MEEQKVLTITKMKQSRKKTADATQFVNEECVRKPKRPGTAIQPIWRAENKGQRSSLRKKARHTGGWGTSLLCSEVIDGIDKII